LCTEHARVFDHQTMHAAQTGKRPFSFTFLPLITHQPPFSQSHTFFLYSFSHFRNESLVTNRKWTPGLASSSVVSKPLLNRAYLLNICARDKQLYPYSYSFPEFKTEFNIRSPLHPPSVNTSYHYLHNMAPYFPSCSASGVAVLPDYRWRLVTWMACIASKIALLSWSK